MWQIPTSSLKSKILSKFTIICFPILYCTTLFDDVISYFANIAFYRDFKVTYLNILIDLASVMVLTTIIVVLIKCNKKAFNISFSIIASLFVFVYVYESNLSTMELYQTVISYYSNQSVDIQSNLTRNTN